MAKISLIKSRKNKDLSGVRGKTNALSIITFLVLMIYTAIMLGLFLWALMSSVKTQFDFDDRPFGFPEVWKFSNYLVALREFTVPTMSNGVSRQVGLVEMLFNSIVYAVGCAVVHTLVTCVVAYVTEKYRYRFSKVIYAVVIFAMIMPVVGSLPSELSLARSLGLYDNFFGMFIMKANFLGLHYLIFYSAFKGVPWDYAEAAFVDGASHLTVMVRIMIPMVMPVVSIVFLLAFIGYWNDYQVPMMFLPNHPVAAYGLYRYQESTQTAISTTPMKIAGCMIVFAPIFVLFLCMKNKLIGNLTVGGLKG